MRLPAVVTFLAVAFVPAAHAQLAKALDLNERGNHASEAGRLQEGIGYYREALEIWSASGPAYDAHRAGTLFNLGIAISATGNRPEAIRILEESLALHRRVLGPREYRTITNANLLASNYITVGRDADAEALFHEDLALTRELFPADIQNARALEGLSSILVRRAQPAQALPIAEEALTIALKVTGEESLDTALAYATVAEAHRCAGHNERALPLFRKSRVLYEKGLGPNHPRVAVIESQEGIILLEDGKLASADQTLTHALALLDENCPNCLVELAIVENNLAALRLRQKRYSEAGQLLSKVVARREKYTAVPGPELAGTLRLLAAVRKFEKRFDDVRELTHRADLIMGYR